MFVNSTPATMTSPAPGSTLASAVVPFTWSAGSSGVVQYWLNAGTTPGGWDLYTASQGASLSRTITGLPSNGSTVYVRLWTQFSSGAWGFSDYTYTAASLLAGMTSPAMGSVLPGASVTFTWNTGSGAVQYWLNAGTTLGGWDLYTASQGTSPSRTITGLPTNGSTVYVRLWTQSSGGAWGFNDYTFMARP